MRTLSGFTLSLILALLGAALWVGISRVYDAWLLVALACLVGGLAGYGMGVGSKLKGGPSHGLLAAVVCLIACLSAKATIAYFHATDDVTQHATLTDDDAYDILVEQNYDALLQSDPAYDQDAAYQAAVAAANDQWNSMSPREHDEFLAALQSQWTSGEDAVTGAASVLAFLFSWRLLDIICFCSALGTAFKIGSHHAITDDEVPAWAQGPGKALNTPQSTAMAATMDAAARASAAPGAPAGPLTAPLPTPKAVPTLAKRPTGAPATGPTAVSAADPASSTAASDSFWTRLGSEPPAREAPSLRRTPKPTTPDANNPPRAEAA